MTSILVNSTNLAHLTNNDSKILGRSKAKLQKLQTQSEFQTNKYKTLNSNWTPLNNKNANRSVFEDRVELVCNWFDLWSDKQRKYFLLSVLRRCRPPQICYIQDFFTENRIIERCDFTQVLPKNLSMYIFSYLSPKDLSHCAQVNSHWKFLSEQDDVWMPKCMNFGWFLPYNPQTREFGAWKMHYIDCILNITSSPFKKDEANKYRDIVYKRELNDREREDVLYRTNKRELTKEQNYEILSSRPPFIPSKLKPNDLLKGDKILYLNSNPNDQCIDNKVASIYNNKFGLTKSTILTVKKLNKAVDNNDILDLSKSLPLELATMRDTYKRMRKSESDLRSLNYSTTTNLAALLDYNKSHRLLKKDEFYTKDNASLTRQGDLINSNNNPHIIFISSKVPCSSLLLECVKFGVIAIPYDYESTNINTLLMYLDNALNERTAKSIGFFMQCEKPGKVAIVRDKSLFKVNVGDNEISNFFNTLVTRLTPLNGKFDFFVPLGCNVDGLELVQKLHIATGVGIRAPIGYLGNYRFIQSKWLNCENDKVSPPNMYFNEQKLNIWISCCEILQEANERLSETVLSNYANHVNKIAIDRIVGKIIFESINGISLLTNSIVRDEFSVLVAKASKQINGDFFMTLSNELKQYLKAKSGPLLSIKAATADNENKENVEKSDHQALQPEENAITIAVPTEKSNNRTLLKSDDALRSFLHHKTEIESNEPGLRTQIILDLVKSEINYMRSLEIIQVYYARPLTAAHESGRTVASNSVIKLLFSDLSALFQISKELVKNFSQRLKNWSHEMCIIDVMKHLCNYINSYMNYANNYDTIINALDKLVTDNPKFRAFLVSIDQTFCTNMMTIQELMAVPWARVKDYLYLLSALQTQTSKDHADQANVDYVFHTLRDVQVYVKQLQDRVERRCKMIQIQRIVINSPAIIDAGRYLLLQQNAMLLDKRTFTYVKDITCFVFNDLIIFAYRIRKHYPFLKFVEESLIYYDKIENLFHLQIDDILDFKNASNVLSIRSYYKDYYVSFSNYEDKYNFTNVLKTARQLAVAK